MVSLEGHQRVNGMFNPHLRVLRGLQGSSTELMQGPAQFLESKQEKE